jgi:hypothetical protein
MKEGSRLIIHRPRKDNPEGGVPSLVLTDRREYGRSVADIFLAIS